MAGFIIVGVVLACCIGVPLVLRAVMRRRSLTRQQDAGHEE